MDALAKRLGIEIVPAAPPQPGACAGAADGLVYGALGMVVYLALHRSGAFDEAEDPVRARRWAALGVAVCAVLVTGGDHLYAALVFAAALVAAPLLIS